MDSDPDSADLTLRPLIADILRTRYCVPDSLFLLESLSTLLPTRNPRKRAIRLLLSDGALCIQGLLTLDMHRFVDSGELTEGCLVRLHAFELCSEEVEGGKRMVYLCVEDFSVVGWCEEYARAQGLEKPSWLRPSLLPEAESDDDDESGFDAQAFATKQSATTRPDPEHEAQGPDAEEGSEAPESPAPRPDPEAIHESDFEDLEDFEAPKPRLPETPPTPGPDLSTPSSFPDLSIPETPPLPAPVALPRDWTSPHNPLKLTPLASVPRLPYRQNWSINALVVVASLSPLQPSTFPPYKQREARLADPSTDKRVLLTVFLEAESFVPRVGSVVLLAGVKNHPFDGGSLKKYVSDRPREGMGWWYEEPGFAWCRDRVRELKAWWASQADSEGR